MEQPSQDKVEHLFVYGTIRRDFPHALSGLLSRHASWHGFGFVQGLLYDLGNYPGLVLRQTAGTVKGELYRLPDPAQLLPLLDRYEGTEGPEAEYRRIVAPVRKEGGALVNAYLYEYLAAGAQTLIESGDYLIYYAKKREGAERPSSALEKESQQGE